jgi:hypothetical protein
MELLLNLCWLSLALPAYWLWQREKSTGTKSQHFLHWNCVLVLGCMLMLLFPVVSATDDLHAMRPEVEESNRSKHISRQTVDSSSSRLNIIGGSPALLTPVSLFDTQFQAIEVITNHMSGVCIHTRIGLDSGRAPPSV